MYLQVLLCVLIYWILTDRKNFDFNALYRVGKEPVQKRVLCSSPQLSNFFLDIDHLSTQSQNGSSFPTVILNWV